MSEQYTTGVVVTGKVTGIQDYGAFVALDAETQGLVHISEITNGYVKDIHDFLKVGDTVEVKVLSIDEEHRKMSLSLKAAKRKQGRILIPNPSENGFNTLREKLTEWIEESELTSKRGTHMSVPLLLYLMIYICKYDCMQSYSYVGGEVKTY